MRRASGSTRQAKRKREEGAAPPDRHAQFDYLYRQGQRFLAFQPPVLSGAAQKNENRGNFKHPGHEDSLVGKAPRVRGSDCPAHGLGKAIPDGGYDLAKAQGWVRGGISQETAEVAVAPIRAFFHSSGQPLYPHAPDLYSTADGGSITAVASAYGNPPSTSWLHSLPLPLPVSPFPPGTSKGKKIAPRLCSFLSQKWRGRPRLDRVTLVNLSGPPNPTRA